MLYFNYGRYLMIAGSRPGSQPMNMQGIWNEDMHPAWGSRYTVNVNTQMNYWPAEVCNLSECHLPLFDLIARMQDPGRKTAKEMYHCRGFVCHHSTDIGAIPLRRICASLQQFGRLVQHGSACTFLNTISSRKTGISCLLTII